MFGNFKRHNDRKARVSHWFAIERDGDMQSFDLQSVGGAVRVWFDAVMRDRAQRQSDRAGSRTIA